MKIKGSSISSKLDFVRERFGSEEEAALRTHLREQGVDVVLAASWYSYEIFDGVLGWMAEHCFAGDLDRLQEVGKYSAEHALTSTYQVYLRQGNFPAFLALVAKLHGSYYDTGRLIPETVAEGEARLVLTGAPYYREPDLQVAAGFYKGAAELMGCKAVRCRIDREAEKVTISIDWQPGGVPA